MIKFIVIRDFSNFIYSSIKGLTVVKCTLYMCVDCWQRRLYRLNMSWCLVVLLVHFTKCLTTLASLKGTFLQYHHHRCRRRCHHQILSIS